MKYKVLLFDLDGTLTNPKTGITRSVQYALNAYGIQVEDPDTLTPFIGPPLHKGFQQFYGFDEAESFRVVDKFREYFAVTGIFEDELFEPVPSLLQQLKDQGYRLAVATSKPTVYAERITLHFDIAHFFEHIYGSNMDGSRTDKSEIIAAALQDFTEYERSEFLMIGDREHDIVGARKQDIDSIGVLWGFGDEAELLEKQPTYLAREVFDILDILQNEPVCS